MANPNLRHDYNFGDPLAWPDSIKGPAYYAPKAPADYSPRDKRAFLTACRDRNCPADRCLDMIEVPDDGDQWCGTTIGRPFGG